MYRSGKGRRYFKRRYKRYSRKRVRRSYRRFKRAFRSSSTVNHFKRVGNSVSLALTAAPPFLSAVYFQFSSIITYADFTNLYDEYRINCCVLKFYCLNGALNQPTDIDTGSSNQMMLHTVIDTDDANTPGSIAELENYGTYKQTLFKGGVCYKFKVYPRQAAAVYRGGATWGYATRKGWVDMGSTDVQHYGFKWAVDGYNVATANQHPTFIIRPVFYFSCRKVR